MFPLPTIPSFRPYSKPHRDCMADPLPLLTGLPTRPTQSNRARFDRRCPHTHGRRASRHFDFAAFNLSCVCEVVPCDNRLAYAGDSTFLMIVDCHSHMMWYPDPVSPEVMQDATQAWQANMGLAAEISESGSLPIRKCVAGRYAWVICSAMEVLI